MMGISSFMISQPCPALAQAIADEHIAARPTPPDANTSCIESALPSDGSSDIPAATSLDGGSPQHHLIQLTQAANQVLASPTDSPMSVAAPEADSLAENVRLSDPSPTPSPPGQKAEVGLQADRNAEATSKNGDLQQQVDLSLVRLLPDVVKQQRLGGPVDTVIEVLFLH